MNFYKPNIEVRVYFILTMARSGHHAFINWIARQFKGEIIHWNNVVRGWEERKFVAYTGRRQVFHQGEIDGLTGRIYNIEDFDMRDWINFDMKRFKIFQHCKVYPIIFLRDPKNWIASSMKNSGSMEKQLNKEIGTDYMGRNNRPSRIELFKRQMREAVGTTQYMKVPKIIVKYPNWFSEKTYRMEIAKKLDLEFTDKGISEVPGFGGGSSFDKRDYDGKAENMKVLERWKSMNRSDRFKAMIKDKELQFLSEQIFGSY